MAIEEPSFTLESKAETYEIRHYPKIVVAETVIDGDFESSGGKAFKILAGYIFGDNRAQTKIDMTAPVISQATSEKIAMTAPVIQTKSSSGYAYQFTMPKPYTLQTLPLPNDNRVILKEIPERRIAVFSYSGSWSEEHFNEKLSEFESALKADRIETKGDPIFSRYNSPFVLWFLRRNEIWLELTEKVLGPGASVK